MDKYNLESIFGRLIRKLPEQWYMQLVVEGSKDNDSWAMKFTNKAISFDRAYMLAEEKLFFYIRAMVQLALIHMVSCGLLWMGNLLNQFLAGTIIGAMLTVLPLVIDVALCIELLFIFHPIAFCKILFEEDSSVSKKEYCFLGFIVKTFAILQMLAFLIRAFLNFGIPQTNVNALARETPLAAIILMGAALAACWYLFRYFCVRKKYPRFVLSEDAHVLTIYDRSGAERTVELLRQFVIEKSGQRLYIGRIAERYNPLYKETPMPYEIPIESIERMELGGERIIYNPEKKRWEKLGSDMERTEGQAVPQAK